MDRRGNNTSLTHTKKRPLNMSGEEQPDDWSQNRPMNRLKGTGPPYPQTSVIHAFGDSD